MASELDFNNFYWFLCGSLRNHWWRTVYLKQIKLSWNEVIKIHDVSTGMLQHLGLIQK